MQDLFETRRVAHEAMSAVLDTNAVIDVYSCHDIVHARSREDHQYRLSRARDSLLLMLYFDETAAITYVLKEPIDRLSLIVPPQEPSGELTFTYLVLYFVKDYLLPRWHPIIEQGTEPLRSNAADRHLVEYAHQHGKPLITYDRKKMRQHALKVGVTPYEPREFWQGRLDVDKVVQRFLRRFKAEERRYVRSRPSGAPEVLRHLRDLFDFYRFLLLGRGDP